MNIVKEYLKKIFYSLCISSLKTAALEQGLNPIIDKLKRIVPDIKDQYSILKLDNTYLEVKARNMHAFQMLLVDFAIKEFQKLTIVDIGDSSGSHLQYICKLYLDDHKDIDCLSVNIDAHAVERIRQKGFKALNMRAEDLAHYGIDADIFLCFQTVEHLMDPCRFLYRLASMTKGRYLIITVPYLRKSRVGLHHIRGGRCDKVCAENTHIFELSPTDWKLIISHSGWKVVEEKIYLQYPRKRLLRMTKFLWRHFDFEGFYGVILEKDHRWSLQYLDWEKV